uniref:Chromo domain-containing protein n=1 Tax=Peronospora matthiolae TaxID=2874970 RepID=A0AAV1V9B2_9STRA
MKNALALKHLAGSLVLPMVDINKGLKSSDPIPRPVNIPNELPLARHEEMSELSRYQDEQRKTQLDASRQRPPVGDACPAHFGERFPPLPPPLEDSRGGQRYLIMRLLNHRDVNGRRTSYLVRWRGYPPSWGTWERRSQLMIDVLGLVEQYDAAHPVPQKDRWRKSSWHGR